MEESHQTPFVMPSGILSLNDCWIKTIALFNSRRLWRNGASLDSSIAQHKRLAGRVAALLLARRHMKHKRLFCAKHMKIHGLKHQTVWGPNGMFLSVFPGSIRQNDDGMVNSSRLDECLEGLLPFMDDEETCEPAVHGDAICADRSCIVGRAKKNNEDEFRENDGQADGSETCER